MTSITQFMYEIADELGRPRNTMDSFIKVFEDNWYDTVESLKNIDDKGFEKFNFPARLLEKIKEKLKGNSKQNQANAMIIEESKTQKSSSQGAKNSIGKQQKTVVNDVISLNITPDIKKKDGKDAKECAVMIEQLKRETITSEGLVGALDLLDRIIGNILKDPKNEKFRVLNLENQKLKNSLFRYEAGIEILLKAHFVIQNNELVLSSELVDLSTLKEMLTEIQKHKLKAQTVTFDPFKSSFSATADMNASEFVNQTGSDISSFAEKLEKLKKQRDSLIKPKIENKDIKIYKMNTGQSISSFISNLDSGNSNDDDEDTTSDRYLFKEQAKKWAKAMEESQQFTSRRRKEFEELVKMPLFTETKVRVKFPDGTILEAKFSPKETLKDVVDLVKSKLKDKNEPFYIYQSPPIQKVTSNKWLQTLDEAECVPSVLFYFALEDKAKESTKKEYLA